MTAHGSESCTRSANVRRDIDERPAPYGFSAAHTVKQERSNLGMQTAVRAELACSQTLTWTMQEKEGRYTD